MLLCGTTGLNKTLDDCPLGSGYTCQFCQTEDVRKVCLRLTSLEVCEQHSLFPGRT